MAVNDNGDENGKENAIRISRNRDEINMHRL